MQERTHSKTPKTHRADPDRDRNALWTLAFGKTFYGPFQLEWLLDQFEWRAREGDPS